MPLATTAHRVSAEERRRSSSAIAQRSGASLSLIASIKGVQP
jgi:hypothetical protein